MRKPFETPDGVMIHYFGALGLRSIAPTFYFGQMCQYIYVGSHEYELVRRSLVPGKHVTSFFCNETPLDKQALLNACAHALYLIRNHVYNIVFLCDGGQHRSKIAAQLVAKTLGCESMGVCEWGELTQVDIDFFATQKDERFSTAMQNIADYLQTPK